MCFEIVNSQSLFESNINLEEYPWADACFPNLATLALAQQTALPRPGLTACCEAGCTQLPAAQLGAQLEAEAGCPLRRYQ